MAFLRSAAAVTDNYVDIGGLTEYVWFLIFMRWNRNPVQNVYNHTGGYWMDKNVYCLVIE